MASKEELDKFHNTYESTLNLCQEMSICPKCKASVKAWGSTETRVVKGLTKIYGILYSVHRCDCGHSFCSYPEHIVTGKHLYRDWETDRKSTRLNSSHSAKSRMPSSA